MRRLHFETVSQTVRTEAIIKNVGKWKYLVIKLPATFKNQKVKVWSKKKNKGKFFVALRDGGTAIINLKDDTDWISEGDKLLASFTDESVH